MEIKWQLRYSSPVGSLNIGIWGLLKVTTQEVDLLELLCFLETKGVLSGDKICSFHFGR